MKQPTIIGFYGESNTGKTTLIIKIIKRLTSEGFKVATVKKTDKKISIDTRGKDTWKHNKAGAQLVVLSTLVETDFLIKKNQSIAEIIKKINMLGEFDIILVEGADEKNIPKIRIGDITKRENTILTYEGDFEKLYEMIKHQILEEQNMEKINIKINGKQLPLTEFPSDIIKNTIVGMLTSLKGVDEIKTVEIKFEL